MQKENTFKRRIQINITKEFEEKILDTFFNVYGTNMDKIFVAVDSLIIASKIFPPTKCKKYWKKVYEYYQYLLLILKGNRIPIYVNLSTIPIELLKEKKILTNRQAFFIEAKDIFLELKMALKLNVPFREEHIVYFAIANYLCLKLEDIQCSCDILVNNEKENNY